MEEIQDIRKAKKRRYKRMSQKRPPAQASPTQSVKSKSSSPMKRPITSSFKYGPVVLPELNSSFQISNAIALFQDGPGKDRKPPTKKLNLSLVVEKKTAMAKQAGVNTTANSIAKMKRSPSPYHYSESPTKDRQRLRSDFMRMAAQNEQPKPLKMRCASLLEIAPLDRKSALTPSQISELYGAKCADLKLQNFRIQEARFQDYCNHYCVERRLVFKELGLGLNTAKVLRTILRSNRKVYYLDIRKNSLGDAGISELSAAIRASTSLVHLDLSSNEVTARGAGELFRAVAVNESITSIDISSHEGLHRNHIAVSGVKRIIPVLQHNKILSILNLSGNGIKVEGLGHIAEGIRKNNTLQSLRLAQNDIQGNSLCIQYLKMIIIESKVVELDLSENPLGNGCMEALAQIIGNAGMALKRLYCSSVGITGACSLAVFKNIRTNGTLSTLRLDRNALGGPELLHALPELITPYTNLSQLNLSDCGLGDEGGEAILQAASSNRSIRVLLLGRNSLGILTATALGELLQAPSCVLKMIDLSHNKIDDSGAVLIAIGIKRNSSLAFLNLSSNSLYSDGGKDLLEAVKMNSAIERVLLNYNSINNRYVTEIEAKTGANTNAARRKKVPLYRREIRAISVDEELTDELEWKTEQCKQHQRIVEQEIAKEFRKFEEMKREEEQKFRIIKVQYDRVAEEDRVVERRLTELRTLEDSIVSKGEDSLRLLGDKIGALTERTEGIGLEMRTIQDKLEQHREDHSLDHDKLRRELQAAKKRLSISKMTSQNKTKVQTSLRVAESVQLDETRDKEEKQMSRQQAAEEEAKQRTNRSRSSKDRKMSDEYEVKEYNASPKLAVTRKQRKKVTRPKELQLKRVEKQASSEEQAEDGKEGDMPEPPVKAEERKKLPTITLGQGDEGDLMSVEASKVPTEKPSPKKSSKKESKPLTKIKKVLS